MKQKNETTKSSKQIHAATQQKGTCSYIFEISELPGSCQILHLCGGAKIIDVQTLSSCKKKEYSIHINQNLNLELTINKQVMHVHTKIKFYRMLKWHITSMPGLLQWAPQRAPEFWKITKFTWPTKDAKESCILQDIYHTHEKHAHYLYLHISYGKIQQNL